MNNDDNGLRGAYDIGRLREEWDALDDDDSPSAWLVIVYTLSMVGLIAGVVYTLGVAGLVAWIIYTLIIAALLAWVMYLLGVGR